MDFKTRKRSSTTSTIHNFTKFTLHWKTVTSFVQLTEKSHATGNPIVRWLNRLQIYGRDKVSRVTSGREGAGTKRCSVQRTFVRVKLFLCILFIFSIRCCWWVLLKVLKMKNHYAILYAILIQGITWTRKRSSSFSIIMLYIMLYLYKVWLERANARVPSLRVTLLQ